jgi:glutaconate CoA-transferase, subunit A
VLYTMIQAGSMGVPYVPVMGLVGSDLLRRRDDMKVLPDPFEPTKQTVVVRSLRPDVAVFHAHRADRAGNVDIGVHTDDVILAEAARHVIVTVEEVVDSLSFEDAKGTFLPGIDVEAVVHAPFGAHPAGCAGHYPVDREHMQRYVDAAKSDEAFDAYLQEFVFGVASHEDYIARHVPREWQGERATPLGGARQLAGAGAARQGESAR